MLQDVLRAENLCAPSGGATSVRRRHATGRIIAAACALTLPALRVKATPGMRIVAVGGAITETLFALGATADVVGVDTTSSYPAEVRKLPNVGYMRTLSAEGVFALSPTHLIVTEDAGPPAVLRQLIDAGVKIHTLSAGNRYEGVLERTASIAGLIGHQARAQALLAGLKRDWLASTEQVKALRAMNERRLGGRTLSVMFVMSHSLSQVLVAGDDTAADSMLSYIGAVNPLKRQFKGLKALSSESAMVAAPDVILVTQQGLQAAGGVAGVLRLPGLADTPAGRARRVVAMDAPLLLGFGPRLPLAVRQLAEQCANALAHPVLGTMAGKVGAT
ncbi:ABC transporter substrate-binding protein [Aquabacterium sp.]|uniref:heme/hemin ABC transporter substrate-binding protein n=1 Tax=Aquabacterium sp. TaxID=1872578 RepID=UPI002489F1BE|nr:ABC transporter substrate-binding protein [Aquabacterium sp.]MDI1261541.1 ABC transporter substrate-binding protein [Aquabacterium sp.]